MPQANRFRSLSVLLGGLTLAGFAGESPARVLEPGTLRATGLVARDAVDVTASGQVALQREDDCSAVLRVQPRGWVHPPGGSPAYRVPIPVELRVVQAELTRKTPAAIEARFPSVRWPGKYAGRVQLTADY